jgi:HK97 family phage prohead protease
LRRLDRALNRMRWHVEDFNRREALRQRQFIATLPSRLEHLCKRFARMAQPIIRKSLVLEEEDSVINFDDDLRTITLVLSEQVEDRQGDIVETRGINWDNFARNPVSLFQHDELQPIGRFEDARGRCTLRIDDEGRLVGTLHLARGTKASEEAWALVKQGVIRAASIGFRPLKDPIALRSGGFHYPAIELLEASLVSIPALQSALRIDDAY